MTVDTVVIGAGPAGLATSRELKRRGVPHLVLERGAGPGHTWAHLYDSLVLHTGKHLSALPGLPFPRSTPLFPTRLDFLRYMEQYAAAFELPVQSGAEVTRVERAAHHWQVHTSAGDRLEATTVVVATGIAANPHVPVLAHREQFRGRVRHSIHYKNADDYRGRRVLVIGVGNSAGEIASELCREGAAVTLSVRSGALTVPREVLGIPIQYLAIPLGYLPKGAQQGLGAIAGRLSSARKNKPVLPPPQPGGCQRVPLIGRHLTDRLREGAIQLKGDVAGFTTTGVRFTDGTDLPFDDVILATGFRAALTMFDGAVRTDTCGFALRSGRVASAEHPNLYFVGHNPDVRGGIFSIGRDARRTARLVRSRA